MKNYLIVMETTDGLGISQLSVIREFETRAEAVKASRDLDPGTYSLLSTLRPNFEVRDSHRVVSRVVDWGITSKPRPRKAKVAGEASPKRSKKARKVSDEAEETAHVQ